MPALTKTTVLAFVALAASTATLPLREYHGAEDLANDWKQDINGPACRHQKISGAAVSRYNVHWRIRWRRSLTSLL